MNEENHDGCGHDHHHGMHAHAIGPIPIPAVVAEAISSQKARRDMESQDLENGIFGLIEELGIERLMVLRNILNGDNTSAHNNYIDGIIVGTLMHKHGVNPHTGKKPEEHFEQPIT